MSRATDFADQLENDALLSGISRREHIDYRIDAAAELRSLDAVNAELLEALQKIADSDSFNGVRTIALRAVAKAEAQQ